MMCLSIGTSQPVKFTEDGIALGALHAAKKNIVVACSAGNSGPSPSTLSNTAPWIFTVGSGSHDRTYSNSITLGNNVTIPGVGLARKFVPCCLLLNLCSFISILPIGSFINSTHYTKPFILGSLFLIKIGLYIYVFFLKRIKGPSNFVSFIFGSDKIVWGSHPKPISN